MDETPTGEMTYILLLICRHLNGAISYQELQNMPLPSVYEINNNLGRILAEENKHG